jgi:hypothetical protein
MAAMHANLRAQLGKHNGVTLSDSEFAKVLNHLDKGNVFEKAKDQASQNIHVDGTPCEMSIGTQLYRNSAKQLKFAWEDPPSDGGEPDHLTTNRLMWRRYYAVAYALYQAQQQSVSPITDQLGFKVGFCKEALDLIIAVNENRRTFSRELERLKEWSRLGYSQPDEDYMPDGILIRVNEG